jgi:four helix bundle protein
MAQFKKLKVWQRAHLLALAVYRTTASFPREELYGLTAQLRRAAVSVPATSPRAVALGGMVS